MQAALKSDRLADFDAGVQRVNYWISQIGILGIRLLWHFVHLLISVWYIGAGIANAFESAVISSGMLKHYKGLDVGKIRYLAVVVESEDACETARIVQLLRWLADIGVKKLCLYDREGMLKKSKESILEKLGNAALFEEVDDTNLMLDQRKMTLEFASFSDGKEAVVRGANFLFLKNLANTGAEQEEQTFTEAHMTEAIRTEGYRGAEPDLMLVYGPVRSHLGFPPWRIRYTEIIHMGPLKSMRYGSLLKSIHKFTMVSQNYGR